MVYEKLGNVRWTIDGIDVTRTLLRGKNPRWYNPKYHTIRTIVIK